MKSNWFVSITALVATALACAQSRPATQPAFRGVAYLRTGGFVGTNDRITITPAGKITVSGRLVGNGEGQLTGEQMAGLAELFADWNNLKGDYKPKGVVHDGFTTEVTYGDRSVQHSDGAENVPESLRKVLRELPSLAVSITQPSQ